MTPENPQHEEPLTPVNNSEDEKPEVYSVKKDGNGFKFNRRGFIAAAAAAATVTLIGANMEGLLPEKKAEVPAQILDPKTVDPNLAISLEIELAGLAIVPLLQTVKRVWRIKNAGSIWCRQALLWLAQKDAQEAAQTVTIPDIAPGESVEIPVHLISPETAGDYQYEWQLRIGSGVAQKNQFTLSVMQELLAESPHPYPINFYQEWVITNPDPNARTTAVHFSYIDLEPDFDFIYVQDESGQMLQTFSSENLQDTWSVEVPGKIVKLVMTSDDASRAREYNGFVVDQLMTVDTIDYFIFMPLIANKYLPTPTPMPTPTSFVHCSCNTVEVCTCNLVCICEAVCSCDGNCGCVGYCSCNRVCTCDTVHYWYPN